MAIYNGQLQFGELYASAYIVPSVGSPGADIFINTETHRYASKPTHTQPSLSSGIYQANARTSDYPSLIYERVWVIPSQINVGFVLQESTHIIEVWNASLQGRTDQINSIFEVGTNGIQLSGPGTPRALAANESVLYNLTVEVIGPSNVDATYTFNTLLLSLPLNILGTRLLVWGYMPEAQIIETYEWLTDVITSYNDSEQYRVLRYKPRLILTYEYKKSSRHINSLIHNRLKAFSYLNYGVPKWSNLSYLTSAAVISDIIINVDTSEMDIATGDFIFIYESDDKFESSLVQSITGSSITMDYGLVNNYSQGALCMPMLLSKPPKSNSLTSYQVNSTTFKMTFKSNLINDLGTYDLPTQLNTLDVLDDSLIEGTANSDISISADTIDFLMGVFDNEYRTEYALTKLPYMKYMSSRLEIQNTVKWLNKIKGRSGTFYIPDNKSTFSIIGTVQISDVSIQITDCNFTDVFNASTMPIYVIIQLVSGTRVIREIISSTKGVGVESITLDSAVGESFTETDITRFSRLYRARLANDKISFIYDWLKSCELQFNCKEVLQ